MSGPACCTVAGFTLVPIGWVCQVFIVGDPFLLLNAEYESEVMLMKPWAGPDSQTTPGRVGLTSSPQSWLVLKLGAISVHSVIRNSTTPMHSSLGWVVRGRRSTWCWFVRVVASSHRFLIGFSLKINASLDGGHLSTLFFWRKLLLV